MKFIIDKNNCVKIESDQPQQMLKYKWDTTYLYSIIKRQKEKRRAGRPLGDNCPMLYALKNSDGLSTDDETVKKLFLYVRNSIKDCFKSNFPFDAVIVMPSKHSIGYELAQIIGELYKVHIITDYLMKNTPQSAIDKVIHNPDIRSDIKQRIKTAINRNMDNLTIKALNTKDRKYVPLLVKNVGWLPVNTRNVLLIDDIWASGTTLKSARGLIEQWSPQVKSISALTLFSPISEKYI
ncbi:phosphoribosyltransferase [Actinobacillus suis]|uniref:phosphoribosyltransferase n=1 Tax=Actinobacillus suis TaxID=716 RepID=UPI0004E7EB82|nr:phosphoribosyltransferase [Actinobacillus suis]AIJ31211.1 hypothetical protein ASU1_04735 [Actinobacillus suis ATCC 33415]SNV30900.1 Uncharacterised protein [Actinobacillus suis]